MDTREQVTRRLFSADVAAYLLARPNFVINDADQPAQEALDKLVRLGYLGVSGQRYHWNRFAVEVAQAEVGKMGWGVYDTTQRSATGARCVKYGSLPMPAARTQEETNEAAARARAHALGVLREVRNAARVTAR